MRSTWVTKVLVVVVLAGLAVVGGTWTYINVIRDEAPARLSVQQPGSGAGTAGSAQPTRQADAAATGGVDGTWKVAAGSQAGYRVKEVLFGQSAEAVGRTDAVRGSIVVAGGKVTSGSFTVDMTTVRSDESRRDNQFRGRVMEVSTYPTSTFELTQPIDVGAVPGEGVPVQVPATGRLTLRGTTRTVTFTVEAQRTAGTIRIAGTIPIVFQEWGIPNPSFGPAQTEDRGVLEFLLVLER